MLTAHQGRQKQARTAKGSDWHDSDFVFTGRWGKPTTPSVLAKVYKKLLKQAELPHFRLHDLRHTSASLLILKGESMKVVSDRLGHTSDSFTSNTYVHLFDEQHQAAALGLEDLLDDGNKRPSAASD